MYTGMVGMQTEFQIKIDMNDEETQAVAAATMQADGLHALEALTLQLVAGFRR